MRALGYARVSSAEQALGTSLQDQQDVIRAHAKKGRLNVARMYVEAESAIYERIERRAEIRALLDDVRPGDVVLVDKLDRWSRDPEFTYRSIRQILERGARFFAIGDGCDPSTPDGDTMLSVRVLVAREEHKRLKIRTVGTRKSLRDRGYFPEGQVPFGYRRQDVRGPDRNVLLLHEERADMVREMFRLCIQGRSLSEIAERLGVLRDRVFDCLRGRVYLGELRDGRGQWIRGRHRPLIDARTFAAAGAALDARRLGQRRAKGDTETASWWLRDIAVCALCGGKMSAAYASSKTGRNYYFRCYRKCTPRYVPVRVVEEQADPMVSARLVELRDLLASSKPTSPNPRPSNLDEMRERLAKRRARVLEQHALGFLTTEELRERMSRLDADRTKLDAMAEPPRAVSTEQRRIVLRDVDKMRRGWAKLGQVERRSVANALAVTVALASGKPPRFEWYSAEDLARRV